MDETVFVRGNHKTPGDIVRRRFLEALGGSPQTPFRHGSGRIDLARAVTDPSNPLFARVMVNRVWLHLFGRGIVPTPDDFGVLGQAPSHPELLDWLADWFRTEGNWSTKKLVKLLVTSSAYRVEQGCRRVAGGKRSETCFGTVCQCGGSKARRSATRFSLYPAGSTATMFGPPVLIHLTEFHGGPRASGQEWSARRQRAAQHLRRGTA
jgi:hypothetical protein